MVTVRYREINNFEFSPIFRVSIAGASQTGKTRFAELLLKRKLFKYNRCYYFHPDCHETIPVEWTLDVPLIFDAEFPTVDTFLAMPEYSCIILDDLVEECYKSSVIDYLFRVLSSKRKLHVIIMSQRYYHTGRYSVSIRNSSNYHVLMRCVNKTMMSRISTDLGLKTEVTKAIELTTSQLYPYIFIDRTPVARANKCEVFIDILQNIFVLVRGSMKFYLVAENDFKKCFDIIDCELAKYADKKKDAHHSSKTSLVGAEEAEETADGNTPALNQPLGESDSGSSLTGKGSGQSGTNTGATSNAATSGASESGTCTDNDTGSDSTKSGIKRNKGSWRARKEYERKFKRALHKFKIRS